MSRKRAPYPGETPGEPVVWVGASRMSKHFHGTPSPTILHRGSCRFAQLALANGNAAREFDGEPRTGEWVWNNGTGFDRACRACCPDWA